METLSQATEYETLTSQQKKQIRSEGGRLISREGQTPTASELGKWAKEKFNLTTQPSNRTISRILGKSNRYALRPDNTIGKKEPHQRGWNNAVEEMLFGWICDHKAAGIKVSGDYICSKGREFQKLANDELPEDEQIYHTFSLGWLYCFRRRWGLVPHQMENEVINLPTSKDILTCLRVVRGLARIEGVSEVSFFENIRMMQTRVKRRMHKEGNK